MLQFILGRAGSGKTQMIQSALKNLAESGAERLMMIVPEQSSFENERAMLHLLRAENARRVSVFSFSRLVDAVQRKYGGFAGRRLDDGGRSIFMSLAIEQVKDHLEIFRKSAEGTELIELLLGVSAELKMCAVNPQELDQASERVAKDSLKRKMKEISLILSAYDALVSKSYIDPLDDLTRLYHILQQHDFFAGYTVMIDSFQSFTVQEYKIMELIIKQAKNVRIALCTDRLDDPENGSGLFSIVRKTAKKLIQIASRNGIPIASPIVLEAGKRFQAPELSALESNAYRPFRKTYGGPCKSVKIYEAKNRYDESAFVCASIRDLVMHEHYRYRDFAVIARSTSTYEGILDSALERWQIPYFMDKPESIDSKPLIRLLLSAFRIVQYGFRSDDIFLYLKTGLAGLTTKQISELEDYTFIWNINGKKWMQEWTDHPDGFSKNLTHLDAQRLERINTCRRAVVEPLVRLSEAVSDTDGEGMASASFNFLLRINAAENLRNFAVLLSQQGSPALAERELRIWDLLMKILDQTALVIGKSKITLSRYAELLRLVILSENITSIPQGLDEVTVGDANRIRTAQPKVVFIVGAVQGEFPLTPGSDRIFSDSERRELIRLGLPLNDTQDGVTLQERFLAYSSLSAASRKLFISYPVMNGEGKALSPSSIPAEATSILEKVPTENQMILDPVWFASTEAPALELAAQKWNSNDTLSVTLKELFRNRNVNTRIAAADRAAKKHPNGFEDKNSATALFGREMRVSATQIEKFQLCRFQYFCRYGLNVQERRTAELNALEYGSLMHFLLQRLFQNDGSDSIAQMSGEELHKLILQYLNEYVRLMFGGLETKSNRFSYLVCRVADSAQIIAAHIAKELSQSGFRPVDFEMDIGGSVGPLTIKLPDGGNVQVDGKIDRVDLMERDGIRYLRIIDYKTGKKEFKLSDVVYGMNMQMLVYLAALCENGEKRYGKFQPAGVLYMPAVRPSVSAERGTAEKALQNKQEKQLRMDGLVLDDPDVISGMDSEAKSRYIPVGLKDGVSDKPEHALSSNELETVLKYLKTVISEMAVELQNGKIEAVPLNGERYNACGWCPYSAVCGHERDDPERKMQDWDRDAVIQKLAEGKGDDGKT